MAFLAPESRPAERRLPGPAGAVRAGRRRPVRRRARAGPGQVGATCPTRTTTSSSRSSARSWASSARSRCSRCSPRWPTPGSGSPPATPTRGSAGRRRRPPPGWSAQAAINIGYVVGLLPVTGCTLPLISSGGTSLVVTMFVFGDPRQRRARHEPEADRRARASRGRAGWPALLAACRGRRDRPPVRVGPAAAGAGNGVPAAAPERGSRRRPCPWSSPAAAAPGTSNRRWRWPTRCAGTARTRRITALGTERGLDTER